MRIVKLSTLLIVGLLIVMTAGCADDMRIQNDMQRKRITELESDIEISKLKSDQSQRQFDTMQQRCNIEKDSLQQTVNAIEKDLSEKKTLVSQMQQQMLHGGAQLPVELSTLLEDFATDEQMVSFDSNRGVIKFKSDLLFERGSDNVTPVAAAAVTELCKILNTEQAKKFDIVVAGHTDDVPIGRPATRQAHPTNWHLSAHRAIAVLGIMSKADIESQRISIRGFGQFRPLAPNKPGKGGNPQNRRVEIYIVAKGM